MNRRKDEMEIDLRELFFVIRKKFLVILLSAMVFAGGAGVYSFFVAEPVYQATAKMYIQAQSTSITSLASIQIGSFLAIDYMELIKSRTTSEEVAENLGITKGYKSIQSRLTVSNPEDTRILNISVTGTDAEECALLANEYAKVAQKQISKVMDMGEPAIFESAIPINTPIKPEKTKNVALGFIIGGFLASLIVVVMHLMDDAIKTPDDVERYLGLNTLGSIPYDGKGKKESKRDKHRRHRKNRKSQSRRKRKKDNQSGEQTWLTE